MINTTLSRIWVLRIGEAYLGIEPRPFKEVLEINRLTPVPLSPAPLLGLLSNQGNILPLFDLGPSLNLQSQSRSMAALVEHQGHSVAFVVDEVVGLRTNLSGAWIQNSDNPLFSAVLEIDNRSVQVLNIAQLFDFLTVQMSFLSLQEPIKTAAQA